MMRFRSYILGIVFLMFSFPAFSWVASGGAKIENLVMHEEGIGRDKTIIQFKDSVNGFEANCYINYSEKNLTSLVLALYMADKSVTFHCGDGSEVIGSYTAHKLHRITTN